MKAACWCIWVAAAVELSSSQQEDFEISSGALSLSFEAATGALATARYGSTVRQARVGCGWTTAAGTVPSSTPKLVHNATTSSICITRTLAAGAKTVLVEDCWEVHQVQSL